ncbi:MAG: hypothetical protein E7773_00285 [Sphingomonas sp.]|uniref:hypothetical protein n=1 Tax=Sphingomonas sp. TaxID=28214 RepID=UPI0011FB56A0|nr:hypothetical protein [Sphingomonas sp.]THD38235.1 MAG: hypothetical protein E7773_00285 [Sphingomonas sp.]
MGGARFPGAVCALTLTLAAAAATGQTAARTIGKTIGLADPYPDGTTRAPVDPLVMRDDDFARNRDPSLWSGLTVERISFRENRARWAFWRIVNAGRPGGVLWVVPHDNENGAFDAALRAVGRYGGILIAVDTSADDHSYAARLNRNVDRGAPIDPNRNFTDAAPRYVGALLADLRLGPRLIVALHSNAPGFDSGGSTCATAPRGGSGGISIRVCSDRYHPVVSRSRAWPFDDDDSMAIIPYGAVRGRAATFCGPALQAADFNIAFEYVRISDGSLSNYALLHGLRYVNFETRDLGNQAAQRDAARARLTSMIETMMVRCLPGGTVPPAAPAVTIAATEPAPSVPAVTALATTPVALSPMPSTAVAPQPAP